MTDNAGTLVKGRKIGIGARGQVQQRGSATQVLISILNEIDPTDPEQRAKMWRVCENLVNQATIAQDKYKYKEVKRNGKKVMYRTNEIEEKGNGDLMAIKEIFDRIDGKPKQTIVGPDDGPVVIEYRTYEEIKISMLKEGIDLDRLPAPLPQLENMKRDDDEDASR